MRTRRTESMVSRPSKTLGFALAASLIVTACAGRQHPFALTPHTVSAGSHTTVTEPERQAEVLQFDNEATVYVDVYIVGGGPIQWRLGRVPAGMRTTLRVPDSALDWTTGFVQLAVIPGSQASADVSRDQRAIIAIAEPVSELLSQRWSFRQPAGAALQLQPTRLIGWQ